MANTRENLIEAGKKSKLSPNNGKHGKRKATILAEEAVKEAAKDAIVPILDKMVSEQRRLIEAMQRADLTEEEYETLSRSMERITKQVELLSGRPTAREEITLTDEEYARFVRRENEKLAQK